jgi:hypothetical protein
MLDSPIKNLLIPDSDSENYNSSDNSGAMVSASLTGLKTHSKRSSFDFVYAGLSENSTIAEGFLDKRKNVIEPGKKERIVEIKYTDEKKTKTEKEESSQRPSPEDKPTQKLFLESNLRTNSDVKIEEIVPGLYSELKQDYSNNIQERKAGIIHDWESFIRLPVVNLWEDFIFEIKDYNRWLGAIVTRPRVVTLALILLFAIPFVYNPTKNSKNPNIAKTPSPELNIPKIDNPLNNVNNDWFSGVGSNFGNIMRDLPTFDSSDNIAQKPDPRITIDTSINNLQDSIIDDLTTPIQDLVKSNADNVSLITKKNNSTSQSQLIATVEGEIEFSDSQSEIFISNSLPPNTLVIIDYNGVKSNAIVSPPKSPLPTGIIGIANRSTREKLSQNSNQLQTINNLNRIKVRIIPE